MKNTQELFTIARALVQERIQGHRKGSDRPAFMHSVAVSEALRSKGYGDEVCLAGLLHDIVEDGGVSLDELSAMGFSERVVRLVSLCTHDASIANRDARWVKMMARLVDAADPEAWAIKLADIEDNLRDCDSMSPDRARFLREVKWPLLRRLVR